MAAENGRTDTPLDKRFFDEACSFGFFQAVRLLERLYPERRPVGYAYPPREEVVRFRSWPSLNFPPSEVVDIRRALADEEESTPEMKVAFFGLTGPQGALPSPYTELLMDRVRAKDCTLWDFLDLFHHRLLSFFYRAWEKYCFPVGFERNQQDPFTGYLFHLIGMGTSGLRTRQALPDSTLIYYGGLVARHPHSAVCIESIVTNHFQVPARVQQFVGQWLPIEEESQTSLGRANCLLGTDAILGSRLWDEQSKFRIVLGPLTLSQLTSFLPNGTSHRPLAELIRFLAGLEFDFDLQLILKKEEVPSCGLGITAKNPAWLGWTTWLKTETMTQDDPQLILAPAYG